MALADILIVSGDSISMVSEAATSGKKVIVFYPETVAKVLKANNKHLKFIKNLSQNGYIYACSAKELGRAIYDVAKGKIHMKKLDDQAIILEAMRYVI